MKDIVACSGKSKSYSVKIEYASSSGLDKVSDFQNITIDCTQVTTPTGVAVEEDPAEPVGHFCGELSTPSGYTEINSCDSISSGGNYILTTNLDCGDLNLEADDVNINGNYCTITGNINASRTDISDVDGWCSPNLGTTFNKTQCEETLFDTGDEFPKPGTWGGNGYSAYTNLDLNNIFVNGSILANGALGENYGGSGGAITISNSTIGGAVSSNGGTGNYYGGAGGMIEIISSNTGAVSSIGGFAVEIGGNGGNITMNTPCPNLENIGAFTCVGSSGTNGGCDYECS